MGQSLGQLRDSLLNSLVCSPCPRLHMDRKANHGFCLQDKASRILSMGAILPLGAMGRGCPNIF